MEEQGYRQILIMRAIDRWENEGGMIGDPTESVEAYSIDRQLVITSGTGRSSDGGLVH